MKHFCYLIFGILGVFAATPRAARAVTYYEFELAEYLASGSDSTACAAVAASLGRRFALAADKPVVRTYCRPATSGSASQDIVIGYQADSAVPRTAVRDDDGGYESDAACRSDLSRQVAIFRNATSSTEFLAYCTPTHLLAIYGLKSPLIRRYATRIDLASVLSWPTFDPQIDDLARLEAQVTEALTRDGLTLSRVIVESDYLQFSAITFYYYASEPDYRIGISTFPIYPTVAECQNGMGQVADILRASDIGPLVQFCAREKSSSNDTAALYTLGKQPTPPDAGPLMERTLRLNVTRAEPESYATWPECQADRPRVEREQQIMTEQTVVGSACTIPLEELSSFGGRRHFRTLIFFK